MVEILDFSFKFVIFHHKQMPFSQKWLDQIKNCFFSIERLGISYPLVYGTCGLRRCLRQKVRHTLHSIPIHFKGPCIVFVGCKFHCDQTKTPTDIFLVPLETMSQGQLIGTNYTSIGALVWPQESKNSMAVFRVKYTVYAWQK